MGKQRRLRHAFVLAAALLLVASSAPAFAITYTTLDNPLAGPEGTSATGISGGNIVGNFFDTSGISHGFLYNGSTYTTLDNPLAAPGLTTVNGISGGNIVGSYGECSGCGYHGFLYNGSTYTTLDHPLAESSTFVTGISGGNIVGYYYAASRLHGFLYNGSTYITLDHPLASGTYPLGISGAIVGYYEDASYVPHGFLYNGSTYTTLDNPLATGGETYATGISGGNIVGFYLGSSGYHGFLYNGSNYTTLDDPLATTLGTIISGIDGNQIVGSYFDETYYTEGGSHGFVAAVPEPRTLTILLLALVSLSLRAIPSARSRRTEAVGQGEGQKRRFDRKRLSLSPCLPVSFSSLIFVLVTQTAQAQLPSTYWTAGTADWKYFGNWNNGVPTDSTRALINNGGTARVFTAGAAANYVGLGEDLGGQGSLEITGGQLVVNFMRIGLAGDGSMAIHNGGKLTSRFGVVSSSGPGIAEVGGTNSTWLITPGTANDAAFDVGQYAYGSLYVHEGGTVSYTYAPAPVLIGGLQEIIGGVSTSTGIGVVIVDGANSQFLNNADTYVGNYGIGRLYVENGAHATNYNADLGVASSGDGTAYVDGPGSLWTNNSVLAVGVSGTAMLSVSNGGKVTSTNGRIGREVGSNGIAFIDGAGSNWTASGDLSVGYFGSGTLNILNGAKVSNQNSNIGDGAGSNGVVTVSGPGSWWQNLSVCAVGSSGTGRLEIHDGGIVSNTNARIGRSAGSAGTVVVDGSLWASTGVLTIGLAGTGTGTLDIVNDGDVSAVGGLTNGPLGTVTGAGRIENNLANGGIVAPGSPVGTLRLKSDYAQTSTATLQIELASATSFDKLSVVGSVTLLGGTLDVSLVGGYVPRGGTYSFDILDWGGRTGAFSAIQLPNPDGTLTWDTSQLYTTGVISVTSTASPDDFNADGQVDAADFIVWRHGLGVNFNQADYDVWRAHFGQAAGTGAAAAGSAGDISTVPEPASALLAATGFFGIVVFAWRRSPNLTRIRLACYAEAHVRSDTAARGDPAR
jgi:T5SS/PEP-CTERM-associated repeat protein